MQSKPISIIGSGSSLKGFDFSTFDGMTTIGLNSVLLHYPSCTYLLFLDHIFYHLHKRALKNYSGTIYCHKRAVPDNFKHDNLKLFETNMNTAGETDKVLLGTLSGLSALNLAIVLGYSPIFLYGFDMYPGHFYSDEKDRYDEPAMLRCIKKFEQFRDYRIYNMNPLSRIPYFPKIKITDQHK